MGRPRRDRRYKQPVHRSTTASPNRGAPDFLKRDLLGMKQQFVRGVPNNYLYLGGASVVLIGGALIASEMGFVDLSFFGIGSGQLTGNASATPQLVRTGENVKIVGDIFGRNMQPVKVPSIYVAIFEDNGEQQYNQMVASDTSHFEVAIPTANFRDGTYSFFVDNKPIVGKPQGIQPYTNLPTPVSPGGAAFGQQPFGVTIT